MYSTRLLDETGDTTVAWDEDSESLVLPVIAKKMAEGMVFYVLEERKIPFLPPRKTKVRDLRHAAEAGAVTVADKDFLQLVGLGKATPVKHVDGEMQATRRAREPREVVCAHTVAVKPQRGG
jgi:hypothetical protein